MTNIVPIPCRANTVSVMTAPPRTFPKSNAASVVSGISALRKACRITTVRSVSPLDRAVRT